MAINANRRMSVGSYRAIGVDHGSDAGYAVVNPAGARRARVAIIGDSFAVREMPLTGPNWYGYGLQTSVFQWTNALLGQRLKLVYASGVNGSAPWEWVSNGSVPNALDAEPDYLWITGALNATTGTTADFINAYSAIFQAANEKGVAVICHNKAPNTVNTTSAHRRIIQEFNDWLEHTAINEYNLIVIPVDGATIADNSLTYQPEASILTDGTHYNMPGAWSAATICAAVLDKIIPPCSLPWKRIYGSADGGVSQIIQSPNMFGSSGGASVLTTTTGVPNGWSASVTAGESGTVNSSARTDLVSAKWLDFDVTFTAANKIANIYCNPSSAGLGGMSIGDTVALYAEIKIDPATISKLKLPYAYLEFVGAGTKYASAMFAGSQPTNGVGAARNQLFVEGENMLVLCTGPVVIPANTTIFQFTISISSQAAGNCKFSIGRVSLVKES